MHYKKIKSERDLRLGTIIKAETRFVDDSARSLTLTLDNGEIIHVECEYWMTICVNQPPKFIKKHRVTTTILGCPISKDFEHEHDGTSFADELQATNGRDSDVSREVMDVLEDR